MDAFADSLLTEERVCEIQLPRLAQRRTLEETEGLLKRKSKLGRALGVFSNDHGADEDDDRAAQLKQDDEDDDMDDEDDEERGRYVSRSPSRSRSPEDRKRSLSRSRSRSGSEGERYVSRSPSRSPDRDVIKMEEDDNRIEGDV